jgi:F0F1-type ATP synthase membrane subunit b/b'
MAKSDVKTDTNRDEFSRIFDEYRAKIEEISRKSVRNPQPANVQPETRPSEDAEDIKVMVARVQPQMPGNPRESISPYEKEAQEIILAARRRAQQIVDEAEEKSRKEASKKTQSQVEKIITKARKEAEEMVAQARQATEKESSEIAAAAKQEAERLIREITERCRRETQTQSNRAIDEARGKADRMMNAIVTSCKEISGMVSEIVTRTRQTMDEFEAKMQTDVGELAKAIAEAQQKLQEITTYALKEREEVKPAPVSKKTEIIETPTLAVKILGAKSNGQHGTQPLFSGQVEMKSISASFDYQYLKNLKKYLVHIPNIRYVQEYASEKEISVLFELKEPLPLLEIIRNVPQVDEIITDADNISITFKDNR